MSQSQQDQNPFEYHNQPVAGVDLSLNCPAICIVPPTSKPEFILPFNICKAYYLTNKTKYAVQKHNINGTLFGAWANDTERYETIAEWVIEVLKSNNVKHVGLEDYAYSKYSSITALAENMGILKYFLHNNNISYDLYSPSSIKKCATGKGNAKKEQMRDAFYQDTDFDIQGVFERKPTDKPVSPVNDIVDAYYLALSVRVAAAVQEREFHTKKERK
jgi:Holliday junction resolvasome RuvABC endonuclease subunit